MNETRIEILVVLDPESPELATEANAALAAQGARVLHSYGTAVRVWETRSELVAETARLPGVRGAVTGPYLGDTSGLNESEQIGIASWNQTRSRSFREAKRHRKHEGLSWDAPDDPGEM